MPVFIFWMILPGAIVGQQHTVSGYVVDDGTGESLTGVRVVDSLSGRGALTNVYGFYALTLPEGRVALQYGYLGYWPHRFSMLLQADTLLPVRLAESRNVLQQVVISSASTRSREHVKTTEMGRLNMPMEVLKRTPALFGENDIIKAVQLMPGVKRGGEGTTGMYVRGGGTDENLILLDEAPVYNVGHLLGFLSVFNSTAIKQVDLYKGAFPAQYGGRLSSIMDVRMREGNDRHYLAQGSIGNIASNLTLEGPIAEGSSFLVSGRRSYLDKLVAWTTGFRFPYYFYDVNAKVNCRLSGRDRVYLSSYFGRDVLSARTEGDSTDFAGGVSTYLGNYTVTARWNHIYPGQRLFHNLTLIRSQFRYNIEGGIQGNSVLVRSAIDDYSVKVDFDFRANEEATIKGGGQLTHHVFRPNLISVQGDITDLLRDKPAGRILNQEMAVYLGLDYVVDDRWRLNLGGRASGSAVEGIFYAGLEPRVSARWQWTDRHALKFGYARMKQYLHLVSSSSLALPTDLWYPVTRRVGPGASDQLSVGWYTYFGSGDGYQFSAEVYGKALHRLIEYREGARLLLNDNYEDELVRGRGRAAGVELLLQKASGHLSGWIGYTLSVATRRFPELNQGQPYFARYDRPHDVSVVANYDFTRRFGVSAAWVYSSGSPFTPVVAKYLMPYPNYAGVDLLPVYPLRNSWRLNPAHRLDIDFVFRSRNRKRGRGEWHIGAYNVYNRAQPNRVVLVFDEATGKEKYQERGLFGIIGSLSYNYRFSTGNFNHMEKS
jgi:hypothetical protein